ncbi:MAG: PRD domain-containing protein [Lachnospiraceae bacterium]|nr:PRD domain-containing protein [Lachnospiraceae bacterium]
MGLKNKDLILEFLEKDALNGGSGVSTATISEQLYIQRTNASRLLNELVEEKKVVKNDKNRPVLYQISKKYYDKSTAIFEEMTGWNQSLKKAVHLAKAAVMYPNKGLDILIVASGGSGKSMFARKIYDYAKAVNAVGKNAAYVKMNCLNDLEGGDDQHRRFCENLQLAENGVLFIENCQYLDARSKSVLLALLSNGFYEENGIKKNARTIVVCSVDEVSESDGFSEKIKNHFAIVVELPDLSRWSFEEKFSLIERFLIIQASDSDRKIKVNSEVLIALLLCKYKNNCKELQNVIKQACASAYAREFENGTQMMSLQIADFPHYVRRSFLNYKVMKNQIDPVMSFGDEYIFDNDKSTILVPKQHKNSIYEWIGKKTNELYQQGFSGDEVNTIVNINIENEFKKYRNDQMAQTIHKEKLIQLVDSPIVSMVDDFLKEASKSLKLYYTASLYYGLCLHLQSLAEGRGRSGNIRIGEIMEFIEKHKEEYALASQLSERFGKEYEKTLSIEETVLIGMFLCGNDPGKEEDNHPAVMIAMHGNGTARTFAETMSAFYNTRVYSYDLPLSKKPLDAYDDIKQTVLNTPYENGILVLCDMGSLKDIFNMVAIETGIALRMIELPFTAILLDCCRKITASTGLEDAYEKLIVTLEGTRLISDNTGKQDKSKIIISVCLTGEGGAVQIKKYLEKNYNLDGVEVVTMQVGGQSDFILELNQISREKDILCIIGTFDPHVYGIPFITIDSVFNPENRDLNDLLEEIRSEHKNFLQNTDVVFEHLAGELDNVNPNELKQSLVQFISGVEADYENEIQMNEKIGLLVHLACAISRNKKGICSEKNPMEEEIIRKNMRLYRILEKRLVELEQKFKVTINKSEIANIISVIKKSSNG